MFGKEFPAFPSHLKRRRSHRKGERISRVVSNSQSLPDVSVHSRETFFPALPWLSSRGSIYATVARGTSLWESLVGKTCGKASREIHRSLDPREGKRDTAATAREESACACPHSRRGLTPLGRLQKYPKIHVSTGEESSGSGITPHNVLRPSIDGRGNTRGPREAPEQLAWGLAFPEATRAGP